jgi:hypothetical protein
MLPQTAEAVNTAVPHDNPDIAHVNSRLPTFDNQNVHFEINVTRDPTSRLLQFYSSHPLPTIGAIMQFFSEAQRLRIRDYGWERFHVDQVANNDRFEMTPRQWQEILVKELFHRYGTRPEPANSPEPISGSLLDSPAFLVAGGNMYELKPVERIRTNGALRGLRKRITAEAHKQADAITRNAQTNATAIQAAASRERDKALKLLKDAQAAGKLTPPQWALEAKLPIYLLNEQRDYNNHKYWCVGITASINIKQIQDHWTARETVGTGLAARAEYVNRWAHWHAKPNMQAIPIRIWVKLEDANGAYNITAIHLDSATINNLPHMTKNKSCMTLGAAPKTITVYDDLSNLARAIERCFQIVDYSSPLVHTPNWAPQVRAFFPDNLLAFFDAATSHDPQCLALAAEHGITTIETQQQEVNETWTAA